MWQASDIYAKPNQTLMNEFSGSKIFNRGTYLVENVDNHHWHKESIKHSMPNDGIFVVRNLDFCSDLIFDDEATDEGKDEIDNRIIWGNSNTFQEKPSIIMPSVLLNKDIFSFDVQLKMFPPINFLQYLKTQQLRHNSTIVYYYHQMWGGETEIEYTWIFAKQDELLVFKDYDISYKITENSQIIIDESVLKRMLSFFDLYLPTGYFALHTREFNWEKWSVNCERLNI